MAIGEIHCRARAATALPAQETAGRVITRRGFIAGAAAACATPLLSLPAGASVADGVLTATDVHVSDYPTVQAVRWIGETLQRETAGRLRIRLYHSGQLGRESESIDMARYGAIDITRVYAGALNNAFPLTQALCLPYVFDSVAHMRRAMDEGVGDAVLRGFEQRGLVGLAIYDSGARCFYNARRPIVEPADLHGLKIRVPASDIFIAHAAPVRRQPDAAVAGRGVLRAWRRT